MHLNPYTVTLQCLRATVVALSNPVVPVEIRRHFIERNPIPGAIYENFLLQNPGQIMPNNYGCRQLDADFQRLAAWRDQLSRNYSKAFSEIGLNGLAGVSGFANHHIQSSVMFNADDNGDEVYFDNEQHMSTQTLSEVQLVTGSTGLTGEITDEVYQTPVNLIIYGARRYQSSVQYTNLNWVDVVDSLLQC